MYFTMSFHVIQAKTNRLSEIEKYGQHVMIQRQLTIARQCGMLQYSDDLHESYSDSWLTSDYHGILLETNRWHHRQLVPLHFRSWETPHYCLVPNRRCPTQYIRNGTTSNMKRHHTAWTTTARLANGNEFHTIEHGSIYIYIAYPTMLVGPFKEMKLSLKEMVAVPYSSLSMFPRSPTCLTESEGAPWLLPYGLKCDPVETQPSLRSPRELLI